MKNEAEWNAYRRGLADGESRADRPVRTLPPPCPGSPLATGTKAVILPRAIYSAAEVSRLMGEAIEAEREACARLAAAESPSDEWSGLTIAAKIRTRSRR